MDRGIILQKLERMGVCDLELDWFKSYISGRRQRLVYDNYEYDLRDINVGVGQGSLLAVLLFQLHINDICTSLHYSSAILYADDTTVYLLGCNLRALKCKMQSDLDNMSMWLKVNKLLLNIGKTRSVLFSRTETPPLNLAIEGKIIEDVKCFKFLGFHMDKKLTFTHHIYHLYNNLLNSAFVIRKLGSFVPQSCLKSLYYAHCHSKLSYGIQVWFPLVAECEKCKLTLLQKRLIRIVSGKPHLAHCMPIFQSLNVLRIHNLIKLENVKLMYRIDRELAPVPIRNLFVKNVHNYGTR